MEATPKHAVPGNPAASRISSWLTPSLTDPCVGEPQASRIFGSLDKLGLPGSRQVVLSE